MNREQKEAAVAELATELGEAQAIFAVDYRGISVPQAAELRAELRSADTAFRVVKNRLTLRAADKAGAEPLKDWLDGPTALALVRGDAALAAKTLSRLGGEFEVLSYKGGLMDGQVLPAAQFTAIAKLPGRDQLNAQFAGIVASPLTGLVRGLGSMISGLALQLGQIAEQGLLTREAPPPEAAEEPPAEGSPAAELPTEEPPAEVATEEAPPEEPPAVEEKTEEPVAAAEMPAEDPQAENSETDQADAEPTKVPSPDEPEPADPAGAAEKSVADAGEPPVDEKEND